MRATSLVDMPEMRLRQRAPPTCQGSLRQPHPSLTQKAYNCLKVSCPGLGSGRTVVHAGDLALTCTVEGQQCSLQAAICRAGTSGMRSRRRAVEAYRTWRNALIQGSGGVVLACPVLAYIYIGLAQPQGPLRDGRERRPSCTGPR